MTDQISKDSKHWSQMIAEIARPTIQLLPDQIELIASQVVYRGPNAKFLVFGCGYDSIIWNSVNSMGYTLFVDDQDAWVNKMKSEIPDLNVVLYKYRSKVGDSLPINHRFLEGISCPDWLKVRKWDVILIDGPAGYSSDSPGRALPIFWASRIATPHTHIFVDDCDRSLEKSYADHFLSPIFGEPLKLTNPRRPDRLMFWYRPKELSFSGTLVDHV